MLIHLSTIFTILFTLVLIMLPGVAFSDQTPVWPMKHETDLSSGFGDYRPDHFHFGIDLRTGGQVGKTVHAPVDGYISRIRASYNGYGKALYLKGDDGYIYVFAHLSQFTNNLTDYIQAAQTASRRYEQDIRLPVDSIRVRQSELIAYSGRTGSGAPHLHFEQRDAENLTLNPLTHGFVLNDRIPPTFTRFGIQLMDDQSLLENGRRKMFLDVYPTGQAGKYRLDHVPYLNSPFGMLVECFDRMRSGGMKQAINKLTLEIDGAELFSRNYDSIDFAVNKSVYFEYDYLETVEKRTKVHRLYRSQFSTFPGSKGIKSLGFSASSLKTGLHHARIQAEDSYGNKSELAFDFMWSNGSHLFELKSRTKLSKDTTSFILSPTREGEKIKIDSAIVIRMSRDRWTSLNQLPLKNIGDGNFEFRAGGSTKRVHVLRLRLYTTAGAIVDDVIFSGILNPGVAIPSLKYEIIDDGLLVHIDVPARRGSYSEIDLYHDGELLERMKPIFLTLQEHVCFVPANEKFAQIDRIDIRIGSDTSIVARSYDSLGIRLYGLGETEEIKLDRFFSAYIGSENLYEPRFVHFTSELIARKSLLRMVSDKYMIEPDAFLCREPFQIVYNFPYDVPENKNSGICWRDPEDASWVWLDNQLEGTQLRAESAGGGLFAVVYDFEPPEMSRLSIRDGKRYQQLRPTISFMLEDTLSGIGADTSIVIELDGKWLIPEYDPESGHVTSKPLQNLKIGRHHLGIRVTDRAGNVAEQYLNFIVTNKKNMTGKNR